MQLIVDLSTSEFEYKSEQKKQLYFDSVSFSGWHFFKDKKRC